MRVRAVLVAMVLGAGCSDFGTSADEAPGSTPSADAGASSDANGIGPDEGGALLGADAEAGTQARPCSAAPLLGNNLANGDSETTVAADRLASFGFEGATTGPFRCVHVHIERIGGDAPTDLLVGLYTEGASNNPGTLQATATIKNAKGGWNEAHLDNGPITTASNVVHFAVVPTLPNVDVTIDATSCESNPRARRDMDLGTIGLPATFDTQGTEEDVCSPPIYLSD